MTSSPQFLYRSIVFGDTGKIVAGSFVEGGVASREEALRLGRMLDGVAVGILSLRDHTFELIILRADKVTARLHDVWTAVRAGTLPWPKTKDHG
jgi:hypothetical protein